MSAAAPFSADNQSTMQGLIQQAVAQAMEHLLSLYPSGNFTWGTMLDGTEPEMYSEPEPGIIAPGLYVVPEKIG